MKRPPRHAGMEDTMRLLDWIHLGSRLNWAYEGPVAPPHRNLSSHSSGQSALLLLKGTLLVRTSRGEVRGRAGQWVFPRDGDRHQKFSDDARVLSIHFLLHWPGGQPLFAPPVAHVVNAADHPRLETTARRLVRLVRKEFGETTVHLAGVRSTLSGHLRLQHYHSSWVHAWAETMLATGQPPARLATVDPRMLGAVQWLDRLPFRTPFREKDLAAQCGISPRQIDRLFVKEFGLTPRAYMERRRLEQAKALIQAGTLLKQVGFELGFRSQSHFSTWFRKTAGQPPRDFR